MAVTGPRVRVGRQRGGSPGGTRASIERFVRARLGVPPGTSTGPNGSFLSGLVLVLLRRALLLVLVLVLVLALALALVLVLERESRVA